jgi:outer membrane protein insertion porin family
VRIAIALGACLLSAVASAEPAPADAPAPVASTAGAQEGAMPSPIRRPLVGFAVRGDSKVKPQTLGYLAHVALGDRIGGDDLARIQQALISSELFKSVQVALEDPPPPTTSAAATVPDGVVLVATVVDKHSWVVAPTVFALPGNEAFGVGYAENNFRGLDQKFLLYAQIGTQTSLLFATFLDPSFRGSKLTWRTDLYLFRRQIDEYVNPHGDPQSTEIGRSTTATYLGGGALVGWNFLWWLVGDLRLRGAYVYFRNAKAADGTLVPLPEKDGWDFTLQAHLTLDRRHHRFGVTWGPYAQLDLEPSIPGLDSYGYQFATLRAYQSWRLLDEHELELRTSVGVARHAPLHEDFALGGVSDLRGYAVDQFRGDVRVAARAEYSVPMFKWSFLAFRALGFYDVGYIGYQFRRPDDRAFLPNQLRGGYVRNDVGAGLRIYLNNIVLPLLGLDFGYGIEGHSPEIYFEVGLTDF